MGKTRYEELSVRLQELRERLSALHDKSAMEREKAAEALSRGEDPPSLKDYTQEISTVESAVRKVEQALKERDVIQEHVDIKRAEIEKQRQEVQRDLAPYAKKLENAKEQLKAVEEEFYKVNSRVNLTLNRLQDEERKLQRLLEEAEPDGDDSPIIADPAKVERYLGELREGKRKSIIVGMDEELDKAVRIYESEVKAIRDWAKRAGVSRKASGVTPVPPECVKHYPKERIKVLTQQAPGAGGPFNTASPGVRTVKVPI